MTQSELNIVVEWIEDRYGRNPKWSKLGKLITDFAPYTLGAAMEAANDLYRQGVKRIDPADLIGPTQRTWRSRVESGIDPKPERRQCDRHTWALPNGVEMELVLAGTSMAYDECANCGVTRPSKPRRVA